MYELYAWRVQYLYPAYWRLAAAASNGWPYRFDIDHPGIASGYPVQSTPCSSSYFGPTVGDDSRGFPYLYCIRCEKSKTEDNGTESPMGRRHRSCSFPHRQWKNRFRLRGSHCTNHGPRCETGEEHFRDGSLAFSVPRLNRCLFPSYLVHRLQEGRWISRVRNPGKPPILRRGTTKHVPRTNTKMAMEMAVRDTILYLTPRYE